MYRTTQDVVEVRRWAEARGYRPCRDELSGRLVLAFPDQAGCPEVGWEEFEPAFLVAQQVFVCDEGPGHIRCFVGPPGEARDFLHGT